MVEAQKTYTVAMAGMGKRGIHHADAFFANSRFEIVGVCDIDQERLDAAADKFSVPFASTDAAQMLAFASVRCPVCGWSSSGWVLKRGCALLPMRNL